MLTVSMWSSSPTWQGWGGVLVFAELKDKCQIIVYTPSGGTWVLWLCFMVKLLFKLLYSSSCLTAFPLFLHSLTSLVSNWMGQLFGTQGRPRRRKPPPFFFLYKQEMGDTERLLSLGGQCKVLLSFILNNCPFPPSLAPGNHHSTFSFCEFD